MKPLRASIVWVAIAVAVLLAGRRLRQKTIDPAVAHVVAELKHTRIAARPHAVAPSAPKPEILPDRIRDQVLIDSIAVSSFFPSSEVADLTPQQLARLEKVLRDARTATYALLLDRAKASQMPNGTIRIEIPAQDDALQPMRDYIRQAIEEIVGEERMKSFDESLGPKFDAKFAYFGQYATTINLSFDGAPVQQANYVTMESEYAKVRLFGLVGNGYVRATSVFPVKDFESYYFALRKVAPGS